MGYFLSEEQYKVYEPMIKEHLAIMDEKLEEEFLFDLSHTELSPHSLQNLLESLGYQDVDGVERNGWQMDFWIYMIKEGHRPICVQGTGISFELQLRGSNEDEINSLDI